MESPYGRNSFGDKEAMPIFSKEFEDEAFICICDDCGIKPNDYRLREQELNREQDRNKDLADQGRQDDGHDEHG
jgi:hypothetical protein